jgi:hypothetical protein
MEGREVVERRSGRNLAKGDKFAREEAQWGRRAG